MLEAIYGRIFLKELKKSKGRGFDVQKLEDIISLLVRNLKLPAKNRNHKLLGSFKGTWECHIQPDWLLIYKKTPTQIILLRTGNHSDLFG